MTTTGSEGRTERADAGRAPSPARQRQQRRITRATRGLALAGAAATAVFALAAAHAGNRPAASTSGADPVSGDDAGTTPFTAGDDDDDYGDDSPSLAPSQAAPTPSFGPPVAQSGGS
jgi:hypothetical protein